MRFMAEEGPRRRGLHAGVAALLLAATASGATPLQGDAPANLVALADPFLGVDGGGNTVPGATVPFGMVSLSPDTSRATSSGYDSKGKILGFSQLHVSGTGGASKYGHFRVTPAIGEDARGFFGFDKTDEVARPGYYAVTTGRGGRAIRSELTATRRVGVHRFTFPAARDAELVDRKSVV